MQSSTDTRIIPFPKLDSKICMANVFMFYGSSIRSEILCNRLSKTTKQFYEKNKEVIRVFTKDFVGVKERKLPFFGREKSGKGARA